MANTADYLLEVGVEELPAGFLETAYPELLEKTREALGKSKLGFDDIEVLLTPRRMALFIKGLEAEQAKSEETVKGPPKSAAYDASGNPTPAAIGFAKKQGMSVEALSLQEIDGTAYVTATRSTGGETVFEILPKILPGVILSLSGSHFMMWDDSKIRFSRPIRWLCSLYHDTPLPLTIGLEQARPETRGHRFFAMSHSIAVKSVDAYASALEEEGRVIVDPAKRRQTIEAAMAQRAEALGGKVVPNPELLETVSMLVEAPALVVGNFDSSYLILPKEVITTVMASHQKYFPIEDQSGKLMPYFITVANNPEPDAEETIRFGNEKVLRARLEDAKFFFTEDTAQPLAAYNEKLSGITFQKGLGSVLDKAKRLEALVGNLPALVNESDRQSARRAALLCKADLATGMVRELTELQGIMGCHYAVHAGESDAVAEAIEAHYHPRFQGDTLAETIPGILVSLADKLDTLLAVFAQKDARIPTGSKDPMGLRRLAIGLIQTVLAAPFNLNLEVAFTVAYQNLGSLGVESETQTIDALKQFVIQRLKGFLLDQGYAYDAIDAVLESDLSPFESLKQTMSRLVVLKKIQSEPERLKRLYEPANRTSKMLGDAYIRGVKQDEINPEKFEDASENALYNRMLSSPIFQTTADFSAEQMIGELELWSSDVETIYNNVLVNAPDLSVRENRYRLLSMLNQAYRQFADFTRLVV